MKTVIYDNSRLVKVFKGAGMKTEANELFRRTIKKRIPSHGLTMSVKRNCQYTEETTENQ